MFLRCFYTKCSYVPLSLLFYLSDSVFQSVFAAFVFRWDFFFPSEGSTSCALLSLQAHPICYVSSKYILPLHADCNGKRTLTHLFGPFVWTKNSERQYLGPHVSPPIGSRRIH